MKLRGLVVACVLGACAVGASGASAATTVVRDGLPPTVAPVQDGATADAGPTLRPHQAASPGTAVSVGTLPTGVAATDAAAYVANAQSNSVSVVDLATNTVTHTIGVGSFPTAVALSSDGAQGYVANFKGGTLSIIDLASNAVTHTVTVGTDPDGVVEHGGTVYVANLLSGTISVVDPSSATVTSTIPLPGSNPAPSEMAVSSDGHYLYVDDARNSTTDVIDLTATPPSTTGTATVGAYPAYLAVHGTTGYVVNPSADGSVSVLDLSDAANPTVTDGIPVGTRPYGIADASALGEVLVSNSGDGTLDAIDTSTDEVVETIAVGTTPDAVAITPDQMTAVVTNEGDNTITILHVNQPPTVAVPGAQQVDANGGSGANNQLVFSAANSNGLSASDPDAGSNSVQVGLSAGHGTLNLGSTAGLTVTGNGSSSMTFSGSLAYVNAALDGLTYTPSTGYAGLDTLAFGINDTGSTGDIGTPQNASGTVSISVQNIAPTAGNVSFSGAIGNTAFGVGTTPPAPSDVVNGSVLANASDPNGDSLTAGPATITTDQGGTVSMNSDGSFTYEPPAGFDGDDTFTFQVSDGTNTTSATATVTVAHMVWYVKNNDTGANDGRSTSPFHTLAQAQTASGAGDTIYVYGGDGTTTGQNAGITLKSSQTLVGAADNLVVGGEDLLAGNSANRPNIGNGSGSGVTLNSGNTVEGLDIAASGSGAAIDAGSSASGGTLSDNIVSGASGAGGIILDNSSGEFDISGLSDTVTGSGPGLEDRNAGQLAVTGSGNTLSTQTGDALDIEQTFITSSGATFQSISAGTSNNGPLYGILLNTTGPGALTVTGTGTSAGSGGTIQNSTSKFIDGHTEILYGNVTVRSGGPVSLSNMTLKSPADYNVAVGNSPDLTLINNTITGTWTAGSAGGDSGIEYVVGAFESGSMLVNSAAGFDIANNTITKTVGPLSMILDTSQLVTGHITGNTIGSSADRSTSNSGGMFIEDDGGQVKADVSNNMVYGVEQGNGIDAHTEPGNYGSGGSSELDLNLTGNTIDDENQDAWDAISVGASDVTSEPSTVCLNFTGNTAKSAGLAASDTLGSDASGAFLHNDANTTVFKIVGGPNENVGAGGDDSVVESYIDGQNSLSGPVASDQQSYALQFGTAGFTTASSCPEAPAVQLPARETLTQELSTPAPQPSAGTTAGTPSTSSTTTAHHATKKAKRLTTKQARRRRLTKRAQLRARLRAHRRHQAALRRQAARRRAAARAKAQRQRRLRHRHKR